MIQTLNGKAEAEAEAAPEKSARQTVEAEAALAMIARIVCAIDAYAEAEQEKGPSHSRKSSD